MSAADVCEPIKVCLGTLPLGVCHQIRRLSSRPTLLLLPKLLSFRITTTAVDLARWNATTRELVGGLVQCSSRVGIIRERK